jgi:hypothetical protein
MICLACDQLGSQLRVLRVLAWRFWTICTRSLDGEGLPEGLRGREGWKSILLGGSGWVEKSWVLVLLYMLENPLRA